MAAAGHGSLAPNWSSALSVTSLFHDNDALREENDALRAALARTVSGPTAVDDGRGGGGGRYAVSVASSTFSRGSDGAADEGGGPYAGAVELSVRVERDALRARLAGMLAAAGSLRHHDRGGRERTVGATSGTQTDPEAARDGRSAAFSTIERALAACLEEKAALEAALARAATAVQRGTYAPAPAPLERLGGGAEARATAAARVLACVLRRRARAACSGAFARLLAHGAAAHAASRAAFLATRDAADEAARSRASAAAVRAGAVRCLTAARRRAALRRSWDAWAARSSAARDGRRCRERGAGAVGRTRDARRAAQFLAAWRLVAFEARRARHGAEMRRTSVALHLWHRTALAARAARAATAAAAAAAELEASRRQAAASAAEVARTVAPAVGRSASLSRERTVEYFRAAAARSRVRAALVCWRQQLRVSARARSRVGRIVTKRERLAMATTFSAWRGGVAPRRAIRSAADALQRGGERRRRRAAFLSWRVGTLVAKVARMGAVHAAALSAARAEFAVVADERARATAVHSSSASAIGEVRAVEVTRRLGEVEADLALARLTIASRDAQLASIAAAHAADAAALRAAATDAHEALGRARSRDLEMRSHIGTAVARLVTQHGIAVARCALRVWQRHTACAARRRVRVLAATDARARRARTAALSGAFARLAAACATRRELRARAATFVRLSIGRALRGWRAEIETTRGARARAERHAIGRSMRVCLASWRAAARLANVRRVRLSARAVLARRLGEHRAFALAVAFGTWVGLRARSREFARAAAAHSRAGRAQLVRLAFTQWAGTVTRRSAVRAALRRIVRMRGIRASRLCFGAWRDASRQAAIAVALAAVARGAADVAASADASASRVAAAAADELARARAQAEADVRAAQDEARRSAAEARASASMGAAACERDRGARVRECCAARIAAVTARAGTACLRWAFETLVARVQRARTRAGIAQRRADAQRRQLMRSALVAWRARTRHECRVRAFVQLRASRRMRACFASMRGRCRALHCARAASSVAARSCGARRVLSVLCSWRRWTAAERGRVSRLTLSHRVGSQQRLAVADRAFRRWVGVLARTRRVCRHVEVRECVQLWAMQSIARGRVRSGGWRCEERI